MRSECPIAEAQSSKYHTDHARHQCSGHTTFSYLLDLHLLRHIGRLCYAETREYKTQEHISAQRDKFGLMKIVGYQRGTKEENQINKSTCEDIKPKYSPIPRFRTRNGLDESNSLPTKYSTTNTPCPKYANEYGTRRPKKYRK